MSDSFNPLINNCNDERINHLNHKNSDPGLKNSHFGFMFYQKQDDYEKKVTKKRNFNCKSSKGGKTAVKIVNDLQENTPFMQGGKTEDETSHEILKEKGKEIVSLYGKSSKLFQNTLNQKTLLKKWLNKIPNLPVSDIKSTINESLIDDCCEQVFNESEVNDLASFNFGEDTQKTFVRIKSKELKIMAFMEFMDIEFYDLLFGFFQTQQNKNAKQTVQSENEILTNTGTKLKFSHLENDVEYLKFLDIFNCN